MRNKRYAFTFFARIQVLGIMVLKMLPTNRARGEGSTSYWIVQHWFLKFYSENANLKDHCCRGRPYAVDNEHLKTLVEKITRQSVTELSLIMSARISSISDDPKKTGKMMKLS